MADIFTWLAGYVGGKTLDKILDDKTEKTSNLGESPREPVYGELVDCAACSGTGMGAWVWQSPELLT